MPLTSGGISNALPTAEKYGALTVRKAIDERKKEEYAPIRGAIQRANRSESR